MLNGEKTVLRFNELTRLSAQVGKNARTPLLDENIIALIEFFEPSENEQATGQTALTQQLKRQAEV